MLLKILENLREANPTMRIILMVGLDQSTAHHPPPDPGGGSGGGGGGGGLTVSPSPA